MLDTIERRVQTDSPLDVTSEEFSRGNYNTIPTLKPAKRLGSGKRQMTRNWSEVWGLRTRLLQLTSSEIEATISPLVIALSLQWLGFELFRREK